MDNLEISDLLKAVTDRQLAVATLQEKYATGEGATTEQLVRDLAEVLAADRVVFDAIITLLLKRGVEEPSHEEALV
jgi:hypothetical protein